jgi:hypothetical protein
MAPCMTKSTLSPLTLDRPRQGGLLVRSAWLSVVKLFSEYRSSCCLVLLGTSGFWERLIGAGRMPGVTGQRDG